MKKNFLCAILLGAFMVTSTATFVSCKDYDDDIDNLQAQIDENKKAIDQINTLISSGSVITSVTKDGSGVTFALSNGQTYTVTNGAAGVAGKDADVWTIGENDGLWYKNGTKTSYKAIGTNGTNGTNGEKGDKGDNGIYYKPNETTGNFDIYNADGTLKETTTIPWRGLGITAVDNGYDVTLYNVTLANGTAGSVTISKSNNLRSLVFVPQVVVDGVNGMTYDSYSYNALTIGHKDSKDENYTAASSATVVNPTVYAEYHVNPSNANFEQLKDQISFKIKASVDYINSRAAASNDFNATPEVVSFLDGILRVKVKVTGIAATADKISLLALNIAKDNGENVISDYATLFKKDLANLAIADKKKFEADPSVDSHFRTLINTANQADPITNKKAIWDDLTDDACDYTVAYDGSLDLNKLVMAHEIGATACAKKNADLAKLGMEFKYDLVQNYKIGTPVTDQANFVNLAGGIFTSKVYDTEGRAAIGRTPIIRVRLMNGDKIVKIAYLKIKIVDKVIEDKKLQMTVDNFKFVCATAGTVATTVQQMNVQVYNLLGMSKVQFHSTYPKFVDVDAKTGNEVKETVSTDSENQTTHVLTWTISETELWANAGTALTHKVRFETTDGKYGVDIILNSNIENIKKSYNVESADFISNYWDAAKTATAFNVAVPTSTTDANPNNCVFVNDLNSPFTTWPSNSTEGTPGVLKLDKAVTAIQYYFCEDDVTAITKIGNIDVTFSVSNDGLTLYAKVGNTNEAVATINNAGTQVPFNTITYSKTSTIAKQLLNTGAMYTFIGAKGRVCDDNNKIVTITFAGKDHFKANFVRPVNIAEKAADNFIDAVDMGEKGSFIRLEDLIAPSDWRIDPTTGENRLFSKYTNYWGFYGPFSIEADAANAQCDLNGVRQSIPSTVELKTNTLASMGSGVDKKDSSYGFITYKNNGTGVTAFNIYVKVKVTYGWGIIMTDYITVPVSSTIK